MTDALHGDALHPAIYAAADNAGLSRALPLALCEAETGRRSDAERWAFRNPNGTFTNLTADAQAAIAADDLVVVQNVLNRIVSHNSSDVSFGPTQQTYRWSRAWREWAAGWDAAAVLRFRALYFDPAYALADCCATLRSLLARPDVQAADDPELRCLWAWNKSAPGVLPVSSIQEHYRQALTWARDYLASETQEDPMAEHSFDLGFADLADQLGADVVGDPLTDEFSIGKGADSGKGATVQVTSRGLMLYASGGPALFLPAVSG